MSATVTDSGGYGTRRKRWAQMSAEERRETSAARRDAGKAKATEALERLDAAVSDIVANDESFREYLKCSARMHSYSWGNRLLIMLQRDTAMVAGYNRWRELDRPVRKGSKGIQILAPMVVKDEDRETGEKSSRVVGFRVAYVFAVEDTDGPPIGKPCPILADDDSDDARALADRLARTVEGFGIPLTQPTDDPALGNALDGKPAGYCVLPGGPGGCRIVVNGNLPAAQRFAVLAHELAHARADHRANADNRRDCEAVAEGAAFVVAAHYGMDTTGFSAPYIAGWAQDMTRVRGLLERIATVSGEIITAADTAGGCPVCGWDGVADHGGCETCR